ncbi:MAG: hypothetical protein M3280_10405, partial [Actinomycetota bacterium]|nr:hypothetical protein [Actinomycetota bacterium]
MKKGGRRLMASLLAVVTCAVLPGAGGTPVAAAPARKVPLLARHNVIAGDRMATMGVRLARDIQVPLTNKGLDDIIDVRAAGQASGFLLEGHNLRHPDGWPLFGYWQMAFCKTTDCKPERRKHTPFGTLMASGAVDDPDAPKVLSLPQGDYTLHVVADRAPVRVDVELPGLKGRRTFRPRDAKAGGLLTPRKGEFNDSGRFVYSQGNRVDFNKFAALGITAVRIRTDANVSQEVGHCFYQNEPPAPPIGFAPGCPTGSNIIVQAGVISPFPIDFIHVGYFFFPSEDLQGFGTWYAAQSIVRDVGGTAFGIDL